MEYAGLGLEEILNDGDVRAHGASLAARRTGRKNRARGAAALLDHDYEGEVPDVIKKTCGWDRP